MAPKKNDEQVFMWSDDEVELLLSITLDYKVDKMSKGTYWESIQSKYVDISARMIEALEKYQQGGSGKEYEHKPDDLSRERVSTKLKAVRKKYRNAVDTGRRSGQGRVIMLYFDLCEQIWGGSPATTKIDNAIETSSINEAVNNELCSSNSTSMTEATGEDGSLDSSSDTEHVSPPVSKTSSDRNKRRALLDDCLTNHKKKKMEKKISVENQFLEYAKQENEFRKEFLQQQKEADEDYKKTMAVLSGTMKDIGKSISDGFASLRYLMQPQPQPLQNNLGWESNGRHQFVQRQHHPNMQYQGFQFISDNNVAGPESEF